MMDDSRTSPVDNDDEDGGRMARSSVVVCRISTILTGRKSTTMPLSPFARNSSMDSDPPNILSICHGGAGVVLTDPPHPVARLRKSVTMVASTTVGRIRMWYAFIHEKLQNVPATPKRSMRASYARGMGIGGPSNAWQQCQQHTSVLSGQFAAISSSPVGVTTVWPILGAGISPHPHSGLLHRPPSPLSVVIGEVAGGGGGGGGGTWRRNRNRMCCFAKANPFIEKKNCLARQMTKLYYHPSCPNSMGLVRTVMASPVLSTAVTIVDISKERRPAGIDHVPTILSDDGKRFVGAAAFTFIDELGREPQGAQTADFESGSTLFSFIEDSSGQAVHGSIYCSLDEFASTVSGQR